MSVGSRLYSHRPQTFSRTTSPQASARSSSVGVGSRFPSTPDRVRLPTTRTSAQRASVFNELLLTKPLSDVRSIARSESPFLDVEFGLTKYAVEGSDHRARRERAASRCELGNPALY